MLEFSQGLEVMSQEPVKGQCFLQNVQRLTMPGLLSYTAQQKSMLINAQGNEILVRLS